MWMMVVVALADQLSFVDVQVDMPAVIEFNGAAASAPHQFPAGETELAMVVIPRDLPRFQLDVPAGTATVRIALAQQRPPPGFEQLKADYDDTMFGVGWKAGVGIGAAATSVVAFVSSGVLALLSNNVGLVPPLVALGVGGAGCLAGAGLCSWSAVDAIQAPEEPTIRRVHVITLTPADTTQPATTFDIDAPSVDSDGEPVESEPVPPHAIPGGTDVNEVRLAY